MDGKRIAPLPVDTLVNGYPIYRKGSFDITLQYRPQRWVNLGLIPSILTLLGCSAFLLLKRHKRRLLLRTELVVGNISRSGKEA